METNMRIRYLFICTLLSIATCGVVVGAEHDFQKLVGAIESQFGVRHTNIPFMGLAKFVVKTSHASGVHRFEIATFEDLSYDPQKLRNFSATLRGTLSSWNLLVQVQSPQRSELTGIFVKTSGSQFKMMVANIDAREATVMELQLSPDQLVQWLRDPEQMGRRALGDHGDDEDRRGNDSDN